ncbi:mitochondrial 54S ribosomal protein YmL9 [Choiromyces venosus 120613-1]|uniref:Large ribosomal subunit protein uL3m n=1 Tax=Choiromyces venosus 120613-1 TaxID=1336337 RepID=A0A3N4IT69_9PEZI|nr:mitochondrial 54S ribosomal protein YmL9 [Choiromyces venosus 120613-1]
MPPRISLTPFLRQLWGNPCTLRPTYLPQPANRSRPFTTTVQNAFGNRPKRISSSGSPELLEGSKAAALERKRLAARPGVLAVKKGMIAIYKPNGRRIACTVLQLERVQVTAVKTREEHGYWAVQVGSGWRSPKNVTRPMLGHYEVAGVAPKEHLREFRVKDENGLMEPGTSLSADFFIEGQYVDVKANCKGHGFAGGMKRHGFSGQPASHGNSLTHRAMGSAGQSQGGGSRVLPGKRMAGRMGGHQVTRPHVQVMQVDKELGTILLFGPVPGPKGCIVAIQDTILGPPPVIPEETAASSESVAAAA